MRRHSCSASTDPAERRARLFDDRNAALAVGVPTTALLTIIFLISAALASLTGSVWALWLGVIEANEAFALKLTFRSW